MSNLQQHIIDDVTGISYTLVGDYYFPDILPAPDSGQYTIGRYGRERLNYLKNHSRLLYVNLLTTGKLYSHLAEIEESATDQMEFITK